MKDKVTLTYEDGKFNLSIDEKVVLSENNLDISIERFKQILNNNTFDKDRKSWQDIIEYLSSFNNDNLIINMEYKSIEFGFIKYFYVTDKLFYLKDDSMVALVGGFDLFKFIIDLIKGNMINDYQGILNICMQSIEHKAMYRISDSTISVASPGFNYGFVEYNFYTKKISKGTSITKGSFDEFSEYVLENLK